MLKVGISRVRNESVVIKNTLDHVSRFMDTIIIYDDCSTDATPSICEAHPCVSKVIRGKKWDFTERGRNTAEGSLRQAAYLEALKMKAAWVYCFDADEYADFSSVDFNDLGVNTYAFRLFNFYITDIRQALDSTSRMGRRQEHYTI